VATPAFALFDDRVEIFAAENITHDTNVLRLSKNLGPESVGATQLGDTVYTTHLGISGNLPVGQQLFTAEYTRYRSDYKYFKDLDFTGHTARAHWQWLWGQDKNGSLGYTEAVGLSSFNNIQKREPDLVTSRQAYFTGNWLVTPRWKATALGMRAWQWSMCHADGRISFFNDAAFGIAAEPAQLEEYVSRILAAAPVTL